MNNNNLWLVVTALDFLKIQLKFNILTHNKQWCVCVCVHKNRETAVSEINMTFRK